MAHKTRTAQVLDIVKVLAWVVIAVSLVKFAFFPAAQEEQTNDGMTATRSPRVTPSSRSARRFRAKRGR